MGYDYICANIYIHFYWAGIKVCINVHIYKLYHYNIN